LLFDQPASCYHSPWPVIAAAMFELPGSFLKAALKNSFLLNNIYSLLNFLSSEYQIDAWGKLFTRP